MTEFKHITTDAAVATYKSATGVFAALLTEVRELSKKKPDATMSASKVKLINNVLSDLLTILENEPQGKYLEVLEDEALPQVSDALMMMVQFDAALEAFRARYLQRVMSGYATEHHWITQERIAEWDAEEAELEAEDGDDA
jgi:hypothetical protein